MSRQSFVLLSLLLAVAPVMAEEQHAGGFWQQTGAAFRSLGHGLAEAGRDLGHGLRDLGGAMAAGVHEGADASAEAGRELGDEIGNALDEIND